MTRSLLCALAAFFVTSMLAADAFAQEKRKQDKFPYWIARDFHRNNIWPRPFNAQDRADVRAPFHIMVHNGWRAQNTLSNHHFDEGTGQLTQAGREKLRWIMFHAPGQHRQVYVGATYVPETTERRLEAVRMVAAEWAYDRPVPPIVATYQPAAGWPAAQTDMIGRKFQSATPAPVLPAASRDGEGD